MGFPVFELLDIDRQRQGLGGIFWHDLYSLEAALRLPTLPRSVDKWLERGGVANQPGPFGKLSFELHDAIFAHLSHDRLGLVSLAVSCKPSLDTAKPHFALCYKNVMRPGPGAESYAWEQTRATTRSFHQASSQILQERPSLRPTSMIGKRNASPVMRESYTTTISASRHLRTNGRLTSISLASPAIEI
ncbi:hypothetical protein C8Q80DRAFT_1155894 [Daedaleopsis nitida]|nr:hypothetical protein C8Q80DRAFT_1155894 [Daedaleopsis nitida]